MKGRATSVSHPSGSDGAEKLQLSPNGNILSPSNVSKSRKSLAVPPFSPSKDTASAEVINSHPSRHPETPTYFLPKYRMLAMEGYPPSLLQWGATHKFTHN